jgi:hypothetical protein
MGKIIAFNTGAYFITHDSDSTHKYSEVDIKEMFGFLIDNIFVVLVIKFSNR